MGHINTWTPQPHKHWEDKDGRKVSIFGAVPFYSDAQRDVEGWHIVTTGWTVYNARTGTYGCGRPPFQTEEEANDWCRKENGRLKAIYDEFHGVQA